MSETFYPTTLKSFSCFQELPAEYNNSKRWINVVCLLKNYCIFMGVELLATDRLLPSSTVWAWQFTQDYIKSTDKLWWKLSRLPSADVCCSLILVWEDVCHIPTTPVIQFLNVAPFVMIFVHLLYTFPQSMTDLVLPQTLRSSLFIRLTLGCTDIWANTSLVDGHWSVCR